METRFLVYHHRCHPEYCKNRGLHVKIPLDIAPGDTAYPVPELRCLESDEILFFNGVVS